MRDFANGMDEMWLRRRSAELCLALALAPVLTWVAPFGVDDDPILARLGFWCGLLASWFIVVALTERSLAGTAQFRQLGPKARRAAVIALAVLPMMPITGAAIDALNGWDVSLGEVAELYFQILMVGSAATLLGDRLVPVLVGEARLFVSPAAVRETAAPPAMSVPVVPLLARLPPDLRGPVLCLEMQDHYVCVHTQRGSALVLMRLRDAIAQTSPIAGRQVHRSWWVADEAVEGIERMGRATSLRLTDGRCVPVSQRYLKDVEDAFGAR